MKVSEDHDSSSGTKDNRKPEEKKKELQETHDGHVSSSQVHMRRPRLLFHMFCPCVLRVVSADMAHAAEPDMRIVLPGGGKRWPVHRWWMTAQTHRKGLPWARLPAP